MSLLVLPLPLAPRKRTSSFSCPPAKAPRVSMPTATALRRTESYFDLTTATATVTLTVPYTRSLQRRRRSLEPTTIRRTPARQQVSKPVTLPPPPPPPPSAPLPPTPSKPRHTSPLAPTRTPLPSRPLFPRSRPEPDLYRKALKTRMRGSPEGQKILRMGPHLAVSMMSATMELERLVASAADAERDADGEDEEGDVLMHDATAPQTSWIALDDWEMVDSDCAS